MQGLVESAKDGAPDFQEVQSPRVRLDIQNRFSNRLIEAYTRVYIAVLNPNAGYGSNARDHIKHARCVEYDFRHVILLAHLEKEESKDKRVLVPGINKTIYVYLRNCLKVVLKLSVPEYIWP